MALEPEVQAEIDFLNLNIQIRKLEQKIARLESCLKHKTVNRHPSDPDFRTIIIDGPK